MNILALDFETFFSDDYSLSKMTTESYVRDPRFEVHGVGLRRSDTPDYPMWIAEPRKVDLATFQDWENTTILCHHAAFDGLILSHHYGVTPARWLDTYSMAQFLFGPGQSKSLGALATRFGLSPKNVPYDKFKGRHWNDLEPAVQREVADACLHDVELTWTIFNRMMSGDYT
jgi:DNA polymerase